MAKTKEEFKPKSFEEMGGVGGVMDAVGTVAGSVAKIGDNLKSVKGLDEKGNLLGKKDTLGNAMAGAQAGREIGKFIPVPGGEIIGAVGGAVIASAATVLTKPPSFQDIQNKRNSFDLGIAMKGVRSEDTFSQGQLMAEKGLKVNGQKVVEAERDEIVLRKIGNSYKKVADFKGGKNHVDGGEDYPASDGDIIIPGGKRNLVNKQLRLRDWKGVSSVVAQLPADTGQETFSKGTKGVKAGFSKTGLKAQNYIYHRLINAGMKPNAAKGLVVNLSFESMNFTKTEEVVNNQHGTKGLGIAMWTDGSKTKRRTAFENFLKEKGLNVNSLEANVDFMLSELKGEQEYNVGSSIDSFNKNSDTVEQASKHALTSFERPVDQSDKHNQRRIADSKEFLAQKEIAKDEEMAKVKEIPIEQREEVMRDANAKKQGYSDYEQYVTKAENEGLTPKSEEWYHENVVAPVQEQKQGYWNMNTPTGKRNYEKDNLARKDFDKTQKPKIGDATINTKRGGKMQDIDKAFSKQMGSLGNLIGTNDGSVASRGENPYSGFSDPKLEAEANKAYKFIQETTLNGTWLGRKVEGAFNFIDAAMVEGIGGTGQVSTAIANSMRSLDPEEVEKVITAAQKAGAITQRGADYLWDVVANPEAFKSQEAEAVEDINVGFLIKDAPRMLVKGGPAAVKWLKGMRASKGFNMKLKAASKSKAAAKALGEELKGVFGENFTLKGTETMDELEALAKQVKQAVPAKEWTPSMKGAVDFFDKSWNTIKKLPEGMRAKMTGNTFKEVNKMRDELTKLTGKSMKELEAMGGPEIAKLVTDERKVRWDKLQGAIKAKEEAWAAYAPIKKEADLAKKSLKNLQESGTATTEQIAAAEVQVAKFTEELNQTKEVIKDIENVSNTNWEQMIKVEGWMEVDEAYNWRNLVKGEKAIAKHKLNIAGLDEDLKAYQESAKNWESTTIGVESNLAALNQEGGVIKKNIKYIDDLQTQKAEVLKDAQGKNFQAGRDQASVNRWENAGPKVAKIHRALQEDAELMKTWKASGRTILEAYNIVRKKGGADIEAPSREEEKAWSEEDIQEATTPDEVVPTRDKVEIVDGRAEGIAKMDDKAPKPEIRTGLEQDKVTTKESNRPKIGEIAKDALGALAEYAPAFYNLAKGMQKPDKVDREFVSPQTKEYKNMSQPQLNMIDDAFNTATGNARNTSGGMMSNFRSNIEKSWADKIKRGSEVNAMEAQRADQVASENIGIRNQADQMNTQLAGQYNQMDMQSKAATGQFLAQGMQDLANIRGVHAQDKTAKANQDMMLKMMGAGRNYDPMTGEFTGPTAGRTPLAPKVPGTTAPTTPAAASTPFVAPVAMTDEEASTRYTAHAEALRKEKLNKILPAIGGVTGVASSFFNK